MSTVHELDSRAIEIEPNHSSSTERRSGLPSLKLYPKYIHVCRLVIP